MLIAPPRFLNTMKPPMFDIGPDHAGGGGGVGEDVPGAARGQANPGVDVELDDCDSGREMNGLLLKLFFFEQNRALKVTLFVRMFQQKLISEQPLLLGTFV